MTQENTTDGPRSAWQELKKLVRYLTTGWRRQLLVAIFVLLTVVVIFNLIWFNRDLFRSYMTQIRPIWLLYAVIFFLIDFSLALWAWHLLVKKLANFDNLRLNIKICLQSNLARRIPGTVWYIASRAVLYQEVGVAKSTTSLLSGLELAFFMVSGVVMTLLTLPFWVWSSIDLNQTSQIGFVFLLLPLGILLVHPQVLQKIWQKLLRQPLSQSLQWSDTIRWLGVYLLTWLTGGLVLFSIVNMLHPLSLTYVPMMLGIWSLSNTISLIGFVTFSFFGLREISLAFLLTQLLPAPITLLIAIIVRLIWLSGELITSLLSFRL